MKKYLKNNWRIIAIIFIIAFAISVGFLDYRSYQFKELKENYCWLALHTYEDFLDNETDYTIGDAFMYLDFRELREACKKDGYSPNKFTERK